MGVGGDVIFAVLDHDQVAVAAQLVAGVNHLSRPGGVYRLPEEPAISMPLLPPLAVEYGRITLPLAGQRQQRWPTGGHDDGGTAEEGTTFAVRMEALPAVFSSPYRRCAASGQLQ